MDLANLDFGKNPEITAIMNVIHPITGEEMFQEDGVTPVTVTLLGMESSIAKRVTKARAQKQLNKRNQKVDLDEAREFTISLQAKLITASQGFKENGQDLDLTDQATAIDVLTRYSWLREQIDEFITDRANFYKA